MTAAVAPTPAAGSAVYVYYADGLSVAEVFAGPRAADHAAQFVAHAAGLPGVEAIWRVRSVGGESHAVELLWRPDPAGPLRPVTPG